MPFWLSTLLFCVVIVAFDGIWSVISKQKHYSYTRGVPISFLIYTMAGAAAAYQHDMFLGVISGLIVAGIDGTVG